MRRAKIIVVVLSFLVIAGVISASYYSPQTDGLHASLGGVVLVLEVADTEDLRARGLSLHKTLAPNEGMLFVFPEDGLHGIWMKDMLFSIDILWLDRDYRIVDVRVQSSPASYPEVFVPSIPVRYVLELQSGFFELHGLKKGDKLLTIKTK